MVPAMRPSILVVAALAMLRIVIGLHFFLEGLGHLRDPGWSSAGFRKAAVGPLADWYRSSLPETGDWSKTLGADDGRSAPEAAAAWRDSVVASWQRLLESRQRKQPLDAAARTAAEGRLRAAGDDLRKVVAALEDEFGEYRLQVQRLARMERAPGAAEIPFERDRITKKRRELAGQAAGWMKEADAIGRRLVAEWDALAGDRAVAAEPTSLWKADRFVSWSLVTIGAALVLGLFVKFNAVGGVCFLASVIASQPFWVPGAQATYDQWVELSALLVLATLPTGGWSGLDYFLKGRFPRAACCGGRGPANAR